MPHRLPLGSILLIICLFGVILPARADGYHFNHFASLDILDDWRRIRPALNSESRKAVLRELIMILRLTEEYLCTTPDPPRWMNTEYDRKRAVSSAYRIFQELGAEGAAILWEALAQEIRFDTPERREMLRLARTARERADDARNERNAAAQDASDSKRDEARRRMDRALTELRDAMWKFNQLTGDALPNDAVPSESYRGRLEEALRGIGSDALTLVEAQTRNPHPELAAIALRLAAAIRRERLPLDLAGKQPPNPREPVAEDLRELLFGEIYIAPRPAIRESPLRGRRLSTFSDECGGIWPFGNSELRMAFLRRSRR